MWDGCGGGGVESTGTGGVEAGDAGRCVRARGAGLGEDCSMLAGHEVKTRERIVSGKIIEGGGVMPWR